MATERRKEIKRRRQRRAKRLKVKKKEAIAASQVGKRKR
jgi:hypothetical protein